MFGQAIVRMCNVWLLYHASKITYIEHILQVYQAAPSLADLTYIDRLDLLKMESLDLRRLCSDVILAYEVLSGFIDIHAEDYLTFANSGHNTTDH